MFTCKRCHLPHEGTYGNGTYCSDACRRRTKQYVWRTCKTCLVEFEVPVDGKEYCSHKCYKAAPAEVRLRVHNQKWNPTSIWDVSSRTITKILKRMNVGCSRCGWKEATCDIHHIRGKQIDNPHAHTNLTILCPNCHRLFHAGIIGPSDVITLEQQVGERWKDFYHG